MSFPSVFRRFLRPVVLALLAAQLLALSAVPALAAGDVTMSVRALLGGQYQSGSWVALAVSLANDGAPVDGVVSVDTDETIVRRPVDLPGGARKEVVVYVRPDAFQRRVEVRFDAPGTQTLREEVEIRAREDGASTTAILGDGGGAIRAQLVARGPEQEPLSLTVADLPPRPEPLRGVDTLVWAADSGDLTAEQRRSLERWVAAGGQLVVIGGPDFQARTAGLVTLLPVAELTARDDVDLAPLVTLASPGASELEPQTAALGEPAEGSIALARVGGGPPLIVSVPRGAGSVTYVAADLATEPFRAWDGAPALWTRLIAEPQTAAPGFGMPPIEDEQSNAMLNALANLPTLDVPPAELLLAVIVGYILLIGPISYLVLRRVDRRELAWVTAPVLVLLFTACSFGIGAQLKGGDVILNQISLVRVASGGGVAAVQTFAGLYSPQRAAYDLTIDGDALISGLRTTMFEPMPRAARSEPLVTEQGDPTHVRDVQVNVSAFRTLRAETIVDYTPRLAVEWHWRDGNLAGTATNTGDVTIDDVAIVSPTGGDMLGDLDSGESTEFSLSLRNFQGMAAGDQVYGFGGGGPQTTDRQRQVGVRREVINGLVGYGSFPTTGMAPGERGPFVIGWRIAPGPTAIEVDGQEVQDYSQVVEVVSGRPVLEPGEVSIGPGQVSVSLVSVEGDAREEGPGFVVVGNGAAVFSITLPLEAADMEVSAVTLHTGNDPMMLAAPGNFGGQRLPPGYRLEVRDQLSGEWIELGDPSEEASFEADPRVAVGPGGRIEARISGEVDVQQFGQMPVFVTAEIEGVIAP